MKMRNTVIASAILLGAGIANANLVLNGSFENPNRAINPSLLSISDWTVVSQSTLGVVITNQLVPGTLNGRPIYFPASSGDQWVNLHFSGNYGNGLISAAIPVVIGHRYLLSFDIGDRGPQASDSGNNNVDVSINFGVPTVFTNLDTPNQLARMEWERFTLEWVADVSVAQLGFFSRRSTVGPFASTIGIDHVVFEQIAEVEPPSQAVPEPTSIALAGLGLIFLGGITPLSSSRRKA
jgi:hypothetical protein